ncbi:MAG: prenyltransferase/squalene oxidase repeat-containing protein [Planctomycetota bacterium]
MKLAATLLSACMIGCSLLPAVDAVDELTPAAARSAERGLSYLATNQQTDGSWRGQGEFVGIVAACSLAFMAYGHVPGSGKYGTTTAKALQYLIRYSGGDGLLFRKGVGNNPMYHHGLAALALAEAWGQTGDSRLRDALKRAVDLICSIQNSRGGWRYEANNSCGDDLSVTVMQLMALRAAKDAGMAVPKEVIDAGITYVKACHNGRGKGRDGGFTYGMYASESGWARTGAGITSLQVAGNYKANEVSEGVEYLMTFKPVGAKTENDNWAYGSYYTTMGMYQAQSLGAWGKKAWSQFYPAMTAWVIGRQKPDGRWDDGPPVYATAMPLLVLAIPCRYLPIYQR